jgi:hypothetical protein
MFERWKVLPAACRALVVPCAVRANSGNGGLAVKAQTAGRVDTVITMGAFDFLESVLFACVCADALAAMGFPVRVLPGLDICELLDTALVNGLVRLVFGYGGSAQDFMSLGRHAQALVLGNARCA